MEKLNQILISICLVLVTIKSILTQNPFYGNQTPPPYYDQNNTTNRDRYNDPNNRYDQNNRYGNDPNVKYDPNNRYNNNDPYNRSNDPNNRYNDPYNRYNDTNRYNDHNRYDPYNRNNDSNRYNDPNNRYNDPNNRYNDPNNRNNDPNNRYNDPNNRYNDPYNRYNETNRYNDPYNRYNDSNRYNDPYNRNNDSNRYNDHNRYNDPNNRYNQDQYNRYNTTNPYHSGSDRYNQDNRYNNQYNKNNDPNSRYNQNNRNDQYGQYNQQNRQFDNRFDPNQNNGPQYGGQNDPNDNCCEEYCYRQDENPSLHFGSKTAYQIIYGKRNNQDVPECNPVQLWSINRHGARLPTEQEILRLRGLINVRSEILRNYEERKSFPYKGRLCNDDLDLIRRWRWNDSLSENRAKSLTSQGIEDTKFLARRFKSKFNQILNQPYRENYFNFQYDSNDYKTQDTYQAYIEGLFDLGKSFNVHANTDMSERSLPPRYCRTLSREIENNNYTYMEYERFKQRQEYLQMTRDIFKRLGFRYTLSESIVKDMYDMCRYEKAWYLNDPSPWCSVFTKNQLEMLEYAEDLQDFYYSGYGSPGNARVGCTLVKDMYQMMKKVVNGDPADAYKVSHYFTQSSQFLRFLTALGVAKDYTMLTADNYYQQRNRKWKLSTIDPFGANLMAVLYNCQRENKYKVLFLLNEEPVNFPECSVGLCDWNTIENKLRSISDNCNKDYCEHGSSTILSAQNLVSILILAVSIFYLF